MRVTRLRLRDFRTYTTADVAPGAGLTVVHGPNGAGKTNLLEGLYFGCTGRSCRTANEREVVRFGAKAARAEVDLADEEGATHALAVGYAPGEVKRLLADGAPVERLLDVGFRPLVSIFLPDRLELVKGPPALRRGHLDQVVAAARPARAATRRAYARALAQRNALLARVRAGSVPRDALGAWDLELARHGIALRDDRATVVADLVAPFAAAARELGLRGDAELRFRPRSRAGDAQALVAELRERLDSDLERGFTGHGPHRDDLALLREGRQLRTYGSRGEQRLGLLALLLAEREVLRAARGHPPLLLLDDVMSELDSDRRAALALRLARDGGQSVITTTDVAHVPGAGNADVARVAVRDGAAVTVAAVQGRAA
ncbi:MAG: DNA replication and repair protein RecF [Solirubrobacteraceae bacterium MAG38_C4-C5]|nr:DNA replication and repair protein RecF [Candidatus Siliceabacter maunaloa]